MCRCDEYGVLEVKCGKEIRASVLGKGTFLENWLYEEQSFWLTFSLEYSVGSTCAVTHSNNLSLYHRKSGFTRIKHNRLKKGEITGLLKEIALNAGRSRNKCSLWPVERGFEPGKPRTKPLSYLTARINNKHIKPANALSKCFFKAFPEVSNKNSNQETVVFGSCFTLSLESAILLRACINCDQLFYL